MKSLGLGGGGPLGSALVVGRDGVTSAIYAIGEMAIILKTDVPPDHYSSHDVSTITVGKNFVEIVGGVDNKRLLVSVNGGDDTSDANRLINGQPNVIVMAVNESDQIEIQAAAITRIAIAVVNDNATTPAGCVDPATSTPTLLLDGTAGESFNVFTFAGGVTSAIIDWTPHATANEGTVTVRGTK